MFFRNLTLFRFSAAAGRELGHLDEALASHTLHPCGPLEPATRGFVSPLGRDEEALTRTLDQRTLFSLGGEDKILPATVVNEEVAARTRALAAREQRRIGGRKRREIKQEVIDELLPRAFSKPSRLDAYVDRKQGWLVIDSASRKAAEGLLTALRQALESFPALPLAPGETPRAILTDWLARGKLPDGLSLGDACELRDPTSASGAVVRCQRQDLASGEIREHLRTGKQVFQLGLEFDGRLGFVLGEDLVVRKLRFNDVVTEELGDVAPESAAAELDAKFALMSLELERLLGRLSTWFKLPRPESST
ncbi:MAG TPA: recombination-associated protein RdgC [Rhodanobacteraceae bacterium]|nr:recombination-associated protein RdgC [Rhodanobacteraceae bacterium]